MTIGERIKHRRKELGLTQEELAHKLGNSSRASICTVEKDKEDLTTARIAKIAAALDTSPAYLMGWVSDPSPDFVNSKRGLIEQEKNLYKEQKDLEQKANQALEKAMDLYEKYKNAPADIQSAVETLLKSVQREP